MKMSNLHQVRVDEVLRDVAAVEALLARNPFIKFTQSLSESCEMKSEKGKPSKGKMPKVSGKVPVAKAQGPRGRSEMSNMAAAKKKER